MRLLYLGRIAEWKAPHIALAGMQALRAAGVDCTLTVAGEALFGESGYRDRLAREAASVGGVKLLGHVEDVARVLDEHDLLLHCSLRPEPFGQVICQAMAHGVPVVATDQGGPRELLAQGGGLLYEPGKVEALVEAVGRVLASYEELSLGALNAARSHTDELIAEHLDRILSQWLS